MKRPSNTDRRRYWSFLLLYHCRVAREDIYSIVDTCFIMPPALERWLYFIAIGNILFRPRINLHYRRRNSLSGPGMQRPALTAAINVAWSLRRACSRTLFKGQVWIQGKQAVLWSLVLSAFTLKYVHCMEKASLEPISNRSKLQFHIDPHMQIFCHIKRTFPRRPFLHRFLCHWLSSGFLHKDRSDICLLQRQTSIHLEFFGKWFRDDSTFISTAMPPYLFPTERTNPYILPTAA